LRHAGAADIITPPAGHYVRSLFTRHFSLALLLLLFH
jgi:hypothetical protein